MTAKQIAVKRYVVKLGDEERERLNTMIHAGKHPARLLTKAGILLKADASEAGEGWSDSRIAAALDSCIDTVARTRQQLERLHPDRNPSYALVGVPARPPGTIHRSAVEYGRRDPWLGDAAEHMPRTCVIGYS